MGSKIRFKQNISELLCCFVIVGLTMILVFEPLNVTLLSGLGVWIIFIAVTLIFIVAVVENRTFADAITLAAALLAAVGIISMTVCNQISYKSLVALVSVLEIPLFMMSVKRISSKKIVTLIYGSFVCVSLFYIVLSFTSAAHRFKNEYGVSQANFLTLGYGNPNKTGMLLFGCVAVLLSYFHYADGFRKKMLIASDIAYMLFLIYRTRSRVCIVVSVLLLLCSFVKKRKLIGSFGRICYIVPVLFVPLYMIVPERLLRLKLFGDAFDTGRSLIYAEVLNGIDPKSFLIGEYSYRFSNQHNLYVSLFATVGILGVVAFAVLYFAADKRMSKAYESNSAKIAYAAICLYMLHSSVESAMFLSGSVYAAVIISLYILCVNEENADTAIRGKS